MQFQRTHIYAKSLQLVDLSRRVLSNLPPGSGFLADQLRRAAASIPLNFAEGYGKSTARDQRRYFIIARGSANEVAAIFDVAHRLGYIAEADHREGQEYCDHLARMLTKFRR